MMKRVTKIMLALLLTLALAAVTVVPAAAALRSFSRRGEDFKSVMSLFMPIKKRGWHSSKGIICGYEFINNNKEATITFVATFTKLPQTFSKKTIDLPSHIWGKPVTELKAVVPADEGLANKLKPVKNKELVFGKYLSVLNNKPLSTFTMAGDSTTKVVANPGIDVNGNTLIQKKAPAKPLFSIFSWMIDFLHMCTSVIYCPFVFLFSYLLP
jgi:hypothetical protein